MLVSSLDSSTLNLIDLNNINNHISRGVNIPTVLSLGEKRLEYCNLIENIYLMTLSGIYLFSKSTSQYISNISQEYCVAIVR